MAWCAAQRVTLALPRVEGRTSVMSFRTWQHGTPLEMADYGFAQPAESAELAMPDLILTPLIGFDAAMNRLGQGAGHYDRYFSSYPNALRIGIAWSVQQIDALDAAAWDVPLDAVCTERAWICPPYSRLAQM
jgi:5-formyltetrahydrofolate cyclo-ligase